MQDEDAIHIGFAEFQPRIERHPQFGFGIGDFDDEGGACAIAEAVLRSFAVDQRDIAMAKHLAGEVLCKFVHFGAILVPRRRPPYLPGHSSAVFRNKG